MGPYGFSDPKQMPNDNVSVVPSLDRRSVRRIQIGTAGQYKISQRIPDSSCDSRGPQRRFDRAGMCFCRVYRQYRQPRTRRLFRSPGGNGPYARTRASTPIMALWLEWTHLYEVARSLMARWD